MNQTSPLWLKASVFRWLPKWPSDFLSKTPLVDHLEEAADLELDPVPKPRRRWWKPPLRRARFHREERVSRLTPAVTAMQSTIGATDRPRNWTMVQGKKGWFNGVIGLRRGAEGDNRLENAKPSRTRVPRFATACCAAHCFAGSAPRRWIRNCAARQISISSMGMRLRPFADPRRQPRPRWANSIDPTALSRAVPAEQARHPAFCIGDDDGTADSSRYLVGRSTTRSRASEHRPLDSSAGHFRRPRFEMITSRNRSNRRLEDGRVQHVHPHSHNAIKADSRGKKQCLFSVRAPRLGTVMISTLAPRDLPEQDLALQCDSRLRKQRHAYRTRGRPEA